MPGTQVYATRLFEKQLIKCPMVIQRKAVAWIRIVEKIGLREVRKSPGYHDEPLKGKRRGQRSIRLNRNYRLIYRELKKGIYIELIEVNKHDY